MSASPVAAGRAAASRTAAGSTAAAAVTGTPQCAVPRNDIYKQVWQPTSAQVRWAVNQAVQGDLTSPYSDADRPPEPWMYAATDNPGTALPQAYANQDFPLLPNVPQVPPLVMYGILAQESNWAQASWHAIPGRSGNPLIANYYGDDTNADSIDYSKADCGYGIAQVTTGMTQADWTGSDTGQIAEPTAQQVRVAVDYATNIAAGVQILQGKWQELHSLGITMNNDDGTKIENWYAAIWAYNSGVHTAPAGLPAGLGWLNNPANPIYPSPRHAFLHDGILETYGDAATPGMWPYQEKVFGWMEVPQLDLNGNPRYNSTYDWANKTGYFLNLPPDSTFCSLSVNNCDPAAVGKLINGSQADPCPAENSTCWWDATASWADCTSQCVTDTPANTPSGQTDYPGKGAAEPPAPPLSATCTPGTPVTTPGTVLVDDEMLTDQNPGENTPNLMGCSGSNPAMILPASEYASFTLTDRSGNLIDGKDGSDGATATPNPVAAIDLHQIGGGLGGHLFFTHTRPGTQSTQQVLGKWKATLPADTRYGTVYQIYAFVPDLAAAAGYAPYEIQTFNTGAGTGYGAPGFRNTTPYRVINQASYTNQWASLGYYLCGGPDQLATPPATTGPASCTMTVTLSNLTPDGDPTQGSDIGYDAVAFVPAPLHQNVILGDSYSSGEGLQGGFDDGTDVSAGVPGASANSGDLCHRAPGAYGRLWDPTAIQLACSGSDMWDIAGVLYYQHLDSNGVPVDDSSGPSAHGAVYYIPPVGSTISNAPPGVTISNAAPGWTGNGPVSGMGSSNPNTGGSDYNAEPTFQTDLLRALQPKRVILTIGGNDAMFANVLFNCVHITPPIPPAPCQNLYSIPGSTADKLDNRINSLGLPLVAALSNIASAAGDPSKVFVVTYPNIFPSGSSTSCAYILASDLAWLTGKARELDNVIATAASAVPGINIVDDYGAFSGSELCTNSPDVTAPTVIDGTAPSAIDNFFHPNSAGYLALEESLVRQIGSP